MGPQKNSGSPFFDENYGSTLVPIVTQSHTGLHESNFTELFRQTGTVFTIFCFLWQKVFKITKLVPQCFMLPIEHYW